MQLLSNDAITFISGGAELFIMQKLPPSGFSKEYIEALSGYNLACGFCLWPDNRADYPANRSFND
jgi:hypothetical protein